MTNMFREFDRICRKYDIKYWCCGGTFIGAIRHTGWIPHDGDIDVCMLKNDYDKFKEVSIKEMPNRMWLQDKTTDPSYTLKWAKIRHMDSHYIYSPEGKNWDVDKGLMIDIFIYKHINDKLIIDKPSKPDIINHKYNDIFPLKELYFEDIKVYMPNSYEIYSKRFFKSFPPPVLPVDKRFPHEGRINPYNASRDMKIKYPYLYSK